MLLRRAWVFGELNALPRSPVVFICGDGDRGFEFAGLKYSQLLDTLNERLIATGLRTLTIAGPYSTIVGDRAFGHVVAVHGVIARASIRSSLGRLARRRISMLKHPVVEAWRGVLTRVRPGIIIGIQPPPELCIAAQAEGIWIADLQHGILSDEGYYGLAYRKRLDNSGWPDCVLCWDDASAKWVRAQLPLTVEARVIGNPWLLRFLEPRGSDELVRVSRLAVKARDDRPTILVSLQWGLGEQTAGHSTGMVDPLLQFIKEEGQLYDWWLRIHPMLMRPPHQYAFLARLQREFAANPNVSWLLCSQAALPVVLEQIDLHMTSHSAVAIEAAWFGVKTALLDAREQLLMEWLGERIRDGSADIVPATPQGIHTWITNNLRHAPHHDRKQFVTADVLDRFVAEMTQQARRSLETPPHEGAVPPTMQVGT